MSDTILQENIRNFAIIAHVDHGKSTLADRLIELTASVPKHDMQDQLLDTLEIERERGITIKLQPIQMSYRDSGKNYILNLIDTPGHVDFSYEVSRTLAAVEGAVLLIDASQGIEAQTLANAELALAHDLTLIPVLNKIDLPNAAPAKVTQELVKILGFKMEEIIQVSAKTGENVDELLREIIARIPAPPGSPEAPARALIFDSIYDPYRGVIAYVRVVDGTFSTHQTVKLVAAQVKTKLGKVGVFKPALTPVDKLSTGLTGYFETGLKNIREVRVGDTIAVVDAAVKPLVGYEPSMPNIYAGLFSEDPDKYVLLRESLERLALNDASLQFSPIKSQALGAGFRAGFLGLLHLEIVQERLRREFGVELISTAPAVGYRVKQQGRYVLINSPSELSSDVQEIEEPWARVEIIVPTKYLGPVLELITKRRGELVGQEYVNPTRVILKAKMPLAEVIVGLFDRLKSVSKGYASLSYTLSGYRPGNLTRLDILINGEPIEALAMIVPVSRTDQIGKIITRRLKELVPPQQYSVPIQAAIGGKIIARQTVSARRKDVTAKLYGGDVTRKRKLLEKQKAGKKRLRQHGRVHLPPETYYKLMKSDLYER